MALNKVEICGVDTSKLPLLKEEEKSELFARIKQGDAEAKERYIKGNLRLVLSVIKRFGNSNENMDDLFQIGCVGLIKAINNFNTDLDVKFSTYAVPTKCSLGKKKGVTSPKWLKIKQYQGFPNSQHHIKKTVLTSAKEIKRTKIGKLRHEIQSGLKHP